MIGRTSYCMNSYYCSIYLQTKVHFALYFNELPNAKQGTYLIYFHKCISDIIRWGDVRINLFNSLKSEYSHQEVSSFAAIFFQEEDKICYCKIVLNVFSGFRQPPCSAQGINSSSSALVKGTDRTINPIYIFCVIGVGFLALHGGCLNAENKFH